MITALARTTLLVRELDEAVFFYRDLLGFEVRATGPGPVVELGVPGQARAGLAVREAKGPDEERLVGRQGGDGPLLTLESTDVRALVAALGPRGVRVLVPPREESGAVVAQVEDSEGNALLLVQRPG
jgi:catechol 2,3-dioxygenase-like lactoylglutathione lyase family enzyme